MSLSINFFNYSKNLSFFFNKIMEKLERAFDSFFSLSVPSGTATSSVFSPPLITTNSKLKITNSALPTTPLVYRSYILSRFCFVSVKGTMADDHSSSMAGRNVDAAHSTNVLDIYPLNHYYFASKEALPFKEETLTQRIERLKLNYNTHGLRTCVQAVLLVELSKHPHLLLLQVRNSMLKLPGGRVRPGESEIECLRRKLSSNLSAREDDSWEVGECLGMWWRPNFETVIYPFMPPDIKWPKECTKVFLVRLPESRKFIVPKNLKLLAVPLCEVHDNFKTYGPIIAGVPQLLSKFSYNTPDTD